MSIVIKDETANAIVLTIDNSGNMYFGDGTPISRLSIAGFGIIDNNGEIIHGLNSCSANGPSGSVNVGIGVSTTITTISGRIPTVQLDTTAPAFQYFMDFRTPGDPSSGGTESVLPINGTTVHNYGAVAGSFTITNENEGDGFVNDPSGPFHDGGLDFALCGYRWL